MANPGPIIAIAGLAKRYWRGREAIEVLRDLDLEIGRGEFVALMGPSGSGKSTLLNLMGGLDTPTRGTILVDGRRIDRLKGPQLARWRSRHVGFVFQFYNLMPTLTAAENVELPLLLTSLGRRERQLRAAAALDLVGLGARARHRPNELSGGQQQRVAIARAIVTDPTLLVCDEPTGDLDRESAEAVLGLLQALNRQRGKTIVMVTHDPKAASFAGRLVTLDKGALADADREAAE